MVQSSRFLYLGPPTPGYSRAMSLRSVMLRFALSLALVLNGASSAAASIRMHADAGLVATVTSVKADAAAEDMPCHQHHQSNTSAQPEAPAIAAEMPAESKQAAPDCCTSGTCGCACVHAAQATLPAGLIAPAFVSQVEGAMSISPGHVAPALPHLIRPPIG